MIFHYFPYVHPLWFLCDDIATTTRVSAAIIHKFSHSDLTPKIFSKQFYCTGCIHVKYFNSLSSIDLCVDGYMFSIQSKLHDHVGKLDKLSSIIFFWGWKERNKKMCVVHDRKSYLTGSLCGVLFLFPKRARP